VYRSYNADHNFLLNNAMKVGKLILSTTTCLVLTWASAVFVEIHLALIVRESYLDKNMPLLCCIECCKDCMNVSCVGT
jgi:hypothetical protein